MKKVIFLVGLLALLVVSQASAAVVLDFGKSGSSGTCTITATTANCTGIAINVLTVLGDGAANGTYTIDSGNLSFNVSTTAPATDTMSITGSVDCDGSVATGPCAGHSAGFELVAPGTLLMQESGAINGLTITGAGTPEADVTFGSVLNLTPDQKSATLLSALGFSTAGCTGTPSLCSGWAFHGFTLTAQQAGTTYVPFSTDIPDTQVPEPASMLLLGTALVGLTRVVRKTKKA